MFTRIHYKAIAEIIKLNTCTDLPAPDHDTEVRIEAQKDAGRWITFGLADYFAKDNQLFDRHKFCVACGIESSG